MEQNSPGPNINDDGTPKDTGPIARAPKKRTFWGRVRKVLAILLLVFILIGVGGMLFIQLPVFKRLVIQQLVSVVEKSTNGTLSIGQIRGNLLEGFVMEDVTLRLKTGTRYDTVPLLHADELLARYSLMRFLRKNEIGVSQLVLVHPVVRLVKFSGDTAWNFSLLAKAVSSAPKAPPQPFTQIVDLASFRILNGSLSARDYNYPARSQVAPSQEELDTIDWCDMHVQGINLDSRFYARGEAMQQATIHDLRCEETQSGFFLQRLACGFYRDAAHVFIDRASITTGHSALSFSLDVTRPRLFKTVRLDSLRHAKLAIAVNGPVISTYELRQFLPRPLGFLNGSPGIDLGANGEFGNLHIKKLALNFRETGSIVATGDMKNLHRPDSLWMNISLTGRNLSNGSLSAYVPGLHLPNLARVGNINISRLTFSGEPIDFHTKYAVQSSGAGSAAGDVFLDLRQHHISYRASVDGEKFNVGALANNDRYQSSITADFKLAGHGTNWRTMVSTIVAKTDGPSSFGKYRISSLDASGAIDAGTLTANHLDASVQGGPEAHVRSATLGLSQKTLPFRFDGTITNFPLGEVLSTKNPARVDLDANLTGHASDFEDVTGTAHARLFDLEYRGHALPDDTADLKIIPSESGENQLLFRSQIADLTIGHRFELGNLTEDLPRHLNALMTAIANREFPQPGIVLPVVNSCPDSIDFDYRLDIKDLRPLADFLPRTFLLGEGAIYGNVQGCPDGDLNMTLNGDSLAFILRNRKFLDTNLVSEDTPLMDLENDTLTRLALARDTTGTLASRLRQDTSAFALPHFESGTPRIHVMPTRIRLVLRDISNDPKGMLAHLDASLDVLSDSVVRLGSALFFHPKFGLVYKDQLLTFDAGTVYNDAFGLRLKGSAHFPDGNLDFLLDTVLVEYITPSPVPPTLHNYVWKNEGPAHIVLEKSGRLVIDSMTILHPLTDAVVPDNVQTMRMTIAGTLQGDTVHARVSIPSFKLEQIKQIIPPFNPNARTFGFADFQGTVRDANVMLSGSLEHPEFAASMFANTIKYVEPDTILFDSNALSLQYRNQVLRGSLTLHVSKFSTTVPGLNISGTLGGSELHATIDSIPLTIALVRGPTFAADSARAAVRPLAAHIDASHFPLDVATPFLPPFRQVQGTGDIHFAVSGTRQAIDYSGNATIENGAVLLAATNMWYRVAGPLTFAHNALTLDNDTVRNIPADDPRGEGDLSGSFNFNGFNITNFDLRLRSDELMVLSDAAKAGQMPVYGPVIINTGGTDFHFHNTFQAPWINGTISIMSANITMPQSTGPPQPVSNAGIIYETLPNDSIEQTRYVHPHSANHKIAELEYSSGAQSVQMSNIHDTLFSNRMKNIYLNDDGTLRVSPYENPDSAAQATPNSALAPSFADKLRMDLRITTEGNATILIPFGGALGLLGSQLNAQLAPGGAMTIERGDELQTIANGGFDLTPNSSFTFSKPFTITSGRITFTKDFSNPNIDITADYIGPHVLQSGSDDVRIELRVSGTKNQPELTAMISEGSGGNYTVRAEASPEQAEEDAIYYLITGQFRNELNTNQNVNATANILQSLGGGLAGTFFNNLLGSTSSQIAFRSAALNVGATGTTSQISAAYRDITIKTGFYVPSTTATQFGLNITTDIPLNSLVSASWARNILTEIQYNSSQTTGPFTLVQQPIWLDKVVWTPLHW